MGEDDVIARPRPHAPSIQPITISLIETNIQYPMANQSVRLYRVTQLVH